MEFVITKTVRNFTYYAKFPSAPIHYRNYTWQGLKNNATAFTDKDACIAAQAEAQRKENEELTVIRL